MGLIDDNTAPLYGVELRTPSQDHLKCSDNSLELVGASYHATLKTKKVIIIVIMMIIQFVYKEFIKQLTTQLFSIAEISFVLLSTRNGVCGIQLLNNGKICSVVFFMSGLISTQLLHRDMQKKFCDYMYNTCIRIHVIHMYIAI